MAGRATARAGSLLRSQRRQRQRNDVGADAGGLRQIGAGLANVFAQLLKLGGGAAGVRPQGE
jgi:hypothetical protein